MRDVITRYLDASAALMFVRPYGIYESLQKASWHIEFDGYRPTE